MLVNYHGSRQSDTTVMSASMSSSNISKTFSNAKLKLPLSPPKADSN